MARKFTLGIVPTCVGPPEGGRNDRYLALIVKLVPGDLGSPFASKANVVAYERHVLFTSDDPADGARACERVRAPPRAGK